MKLARALLIALVAAPTLAPGQSSHVDIEQRLTPEQQHATGIDLLSPAQLTLLNQLLREQSERIDIPLRPAEIPKTTTPASEPRSAAAPAPSVAPATPPPGSKFIGLDDQPIKTRVQGSVSGWAPGSEFLLENGQRWKVLKGEVNLPAPLENPAVVVLPGISGRWFLQVDENLPSARVYRIE